jgi:hypothetical protein
VSDIFLFVFGFLLFVLVCPFVLRLFLLFRLFSFISL